MPTSAVQNPPEYKAKPMPWNGYVFRSQAECYAAMFLTHLGVEFMYEPEAYLLGDPPRPTRPDFWLPNLNGGAWLEIKGFDTFDDAQVRALSSAHETVPVYVATAPLWSRASDGRETRSMFKYLGGARLDQQHEFCRCARCLQWTIQYHGYQSRHDCGIENRYLVNPDYRDAVAEIEAKAASDIAAAGRECERFRVWSTISR